MLAVLQIYHYMTLGGTSPTLPAISRLVRSIHLDTGIQGTWIVGVNHQGSNRASAEAVVYRRPGDSAIKRLVDAGVLRAHVPDVRVGGVDDDGGDDIARQELAHRQS